MADDLSLPMHSPPVVDGDTDSAADAQEAYVPPEIDAPPGDPSSPVAAPPSSDPPSAFDVVTPVSRLDTICTDRRKLVGVVAGIFLVAAVALVVLVAGSDDSSAGGGAALIKTFDTDSFAPLATSASQSDLDRDRLTIAVAALGSKLYAVGGAGTGGSSVAKYHRGLKNDHHLHCDASASSTPLQPKTVPLPTSQLEGIAALPTERDWSVEMNPVKNQEQCGSCWAFATNAIVEFAIGAKAKGVLVNPSELLDQSMRMAPGYGDSDDGFCRLGAEAVNQRCGGTGGCEGLTTLAGLNMLKCEPGGVHLWPDKQAEVEMYEEYYHCLKDDPPAHAAAAGKANSCKYANDGECDDGSQGGTQYCAIGTDTNDCAAAAAAAGCTAAGCTETGGSVSVSDDSCRYANDGECDDGSQGGSTQYCATGTDATDCAAETLAAAAQPQLFDPSGDREERCDFQAALERISQPLATEPLDSFDVVEVEAYVDEDGAVCDMNKEDDAGQECFPNVLGMVEALQYGPIAVGVDATPLQYYRPGHSAARSRTPYVVSADVSKCDTMCGVDKSCKEECATVASKAVAAQTSPTVDHAVVIVGYGEDVLGGPYWKIRNSWSEAFGEDGHVRVERATGAIPCGVDTRLQDGNGCKADLDGVDISADCSARYCGAMGVISPGMVQMRSSSSSSSTSQ
jgi:hypothetical protein